MFVEVGRTEFLALVEPRGVDEVALDEVGKGGKEEQGCVRKWVEVRRKWEKRMEVGGSEGKRRDTEGLQK